MAKIDSFLKLGREDGCSDLHFAAGTPPLLRRHGKLAPIQFHELERDEIDDLIEEILDADQRAAFADRRDLDFTYTSEEVGRFRVNVYRKMGGPGATFRVIPSTVPSIRELGLPAVLKELAVARQGLVLVTGAAGTGKSTTLAAMVGHLNETRKLNIITLEDPIEYVHLGKQSQIVQREVGSHLESFADGLRAALREDPDVIMVGELRDTETISLAMVAAETGHLVFGTLHTTSATKTLDRLIDAVPAQQKGQTAVFLAQHLRGVISQRLVRSADGQRRRAIVEILINTPAIANLIQKRKIFLIPDQLQTGREQGMQLMDQALREALNRGEIDPNDAYMMADNKKPFRRFVTDPSILPRLSVAGQ